MAEKRFTRVRASAGSGKTHNLINQYMARAADLAPDAVATRRACAYDADSTAAAMNEILAITFTNAAAGEMRDRVIAAFKESALGKSDLDNPLPPETAGEWLERIIRDPRCLNIRTIDSLTHMIVRASALDLKLNPDFETEFVTSEALEPYLDAFLQEATVNPELEKLLKNACQALIDRSAKGFRPKDQIVGGVKDLLNDALIGKLENFSTFEETKAASRRILEETRESAAVLLALGDKEKVDWNATSRKAIARLASDGDWPEKLPACLLDAAKLTKKAAAFSTDFAEAGRDCAEKAQKYYDHYETLNKAGLYLALITISRLLAEAFRKRMDQEAWLPAALIPGLARKALRSPNGVSDAICRLGTRITHILIDEFQDTGDEQWDALFPLVEEALSRGGTYAYVGDVKQSIYGFRNGNPRLFNEIIDNPALKNIADGAETVDLGENWRSGANIINFNNSLFAQIGEEAVAKQLLEIMGGKLDDQLLNEGAAILAENYRDAEQKVSPKERPDGIVRVTAFEAPGADKLDEEILANLEETVREIYKRRGKWSDICALARHNEKAALAAQTLMKAGVPVVTENSLLIKDHPLIRQTIAFLSFLANDADDLAFWTLLNGSLVLDHPETAKELDRETLNIWALRKRSLPMSERFASDFPDLWAKLFEPFHKGASLTTPYDLVMEWYKRTSAEERFPDDETFLRRFMEILYLAEENGYSSVGSFLDYWRDKGDGEKAPMPEFMDAVRVMTIHKAKGLQAPAIIVPWTNFGAFPKSKIIAADFENLRLPVNTRTKNAGEEYEKGVIEQLIENVNMLYVAFTRPMEELWIFAATSSSNKKPVAADGLKFLLANAGYELPTEIGEPARMECEDAEKKESVAAEPTAYPLEKDWEPMSWLPRLKIFHSPKDEGFTSEKRGEFLHYCLQRLKFDGDAGADALDSFQAGVASSGIDIPEDAKIRADALEAIQWVRSLPEARSWYDGAFFEQTILDENGDARRVDLAAPRGDGFLIVDFKTGSSNRENKEQLELYLNLLKKIYPGANINGLLAYVDLKKIERV